jgi:hypothetical protein
LAARRDRYKTPDNFVNTKPVTTFDPRIKNLYKSATELVGIDGPKDELMDMLSLLGDDDDGDLSDHNKMKIVSIVGSGGLGKTTLSRAVYDQLKLRFECQAFVPVGRNPDMKKALRDILIDLDKEKFMNSYMIMLDEKQLMDELKEFVKEKRYESLHTCMRIETFSYFSVSTLQCNSFLIYLIITLLRLEGASIYVPLQVYKLLVYI